MSSGPRSGFWVSTFASVHGLRLAAAAWNSVTPEPGTAKVADRSCASASLTALATANRHGAGIFRPARREGGIARLLEYRPPAIPAGLQQPEPVDEHDRSELSCIGLLDLLRFEIGDV